MTIKSFYPFLLNERPDFLFPSKKNDLNYFSLYIWNRNVTNTQTLEQNRKSVCSCYMTLMASQNYLSSSNLYFFERTIHVQNQITYLLNTQNLYIDTTMLQMCISYKKWFYMYLIFNFLFGKYLNKVNGIYWFTKGATKQGVLNFVHVLHRFSMFLTTSLILNSPHHRSNVYRLALLTDRI